MIVVLPDARREAPLRCFLKTVSIYEGKSTEPYNAISYYWGSTKETETVEVYGESREYDRVGESFKIPITSNLALALRQFRSDATTERRRLVIWTDALRINQTDPEERSGQVSIMRDIYKAARSVWMWIGGTSLAAEAGLHNLYFYANDTQPSKIFTEMCPNARLDEMMALQAIATRGVNDAFYCLYQRNLVEYFSAAYWQRGWIIQEATANKNTYICYGPARYHLVSWSSLRELVVNLPNENHEGPQYHFVSQIFQLQVCQDSWKHAGMQSMEQVRQLRTAKSECVFIRRWIYSMFTGNSWHTSDPRDRVNAIMGAMPPYCSLNFRPDYSKSAEDVFISATVHLLHTGRSWSHTQFLAPSDSPYLPSWSIDFADARPFFPSGAFYSDDYFTFLGTYVMSLYLPSKAKKYRFAADAVAPIRLRQVSRGVLETAGFVIDKVVSVGSLFTATLDCKDDAKGVLRAWYRLLSQNRRYTRRNTILRGRARKWEAFCRTLCMGRVGDLEFDASHVPASEALWDNVTHGRQRHPGSMLGQVQNLFTQMYPILIAARFIVTRKGRIAVAPRNVAVGDSIGVLASGDVPFVLRRAKAKDVSGDAYILIGGCYVDGKASGGSSCTSTADRNRCHVRRSRRRGG